MMDEFNRTRDAFRNSVLALRVLGPSWAVEGAERLDVEINKLAELAFTMQKGITAEHIRPRAASQASSSGGGTAMWAQGSGFGCIVGSANQPGRTLES